MRKWFPQLYRCYASADLAALQRRWSRKAQEVAPDGAGRRLDDGTTVWVSPHDLTPDDKWL